MELEFAESLAGQGFGDARLLAAVMQVDRETFLSPAARGRAHADEEADLGFGRTAPRPSVVATMLSALGAQAGERVLEIGTGGGYGAALLRELGCEVFSVEPVRALAEHAALRLAALEIHAALHVGRALRGWPEQAPFAAVVVMGQVDEVPQGLLAQLAEGGRLAAPVGPANQQVLRVFRRTPVGLRTDDLGSVRLPPLGEG